MKRSVTSESENEPSTKKASMDDEKTHLFLAGADFFLHSAALRKNLSEKY
jgi:hypothetical protein